MFHDGGGNRSQTVAALRELIPLLQARGFRFVTVSELAGPAAKRRRAGGSRRGSAAAGDVFAAAVRFGVPARVRSSLSGRARRPPVRAHASCSSLALATWHQRRAQTPAPAEPRPPAARRRRRSRLQRGRRHRARGPLARRERLPGLRGRRRRRRLDGRHGRDRRAARARARPAHPQGERRQAVGAERRHRGTAAPVDRDGRRRHASSSPTTLRRLVQPLADPSASARSPGTRRSATGADCSAAGSTSST